MNVVIHIAISYHQARWVRQRSIPIDLKVGGRSSHRLSLPENVSNCISDYLVCIKAQCDVRCNLGKRRGELVVNWFNCANWPCLGSGSERDKGCHSTEPSTIS